MCAVAVAESAIDPLEYQDLVNLLARLYVGRGVPFEDLESAGYLALYNAFRLYDPTKGAFKDYAFVSIRHGMTREIADHRRVISMPRDRYYAPRLDRFVSQAVLEAADRAKSMSRINRDPYSGLELINIQESRGGNRDLDILETKEAIDHLLLQLPERERYVISMRFGLDGHAEHKLHEIGLVLGLTKERVRQIEAKALERLQPFAATMAA